MAFSSNVHSHILLDLELRVITTERHTTGIFHQPTGCAVSKPWNEYGGETGLFVVQNLHRDFHVYCLIYIPI